MNLVALALDGKVATVSLISRRLGWPPAWACVYVLYVDSYCSSTPLTKIFYLKRHAHQQTM